MANTDFKSVDEYLATKGKDVQAVLQKVRSTIRKALPGAREVISYQIPAFRTDDGMVLFFAGWAEHYSLYPAGVALEKAFKKELAPYDLSHKGTIRFPLSEPVPVKLIERIARFRAKEVEERAEAKAAAKPKKRPVRASGTAARR
jgi:uncharacterized protein YdhG (YjbR/CyaY superfamily)